MGREKEMMDEKEKQGKVKGNENALAEHIQQNHDHEIQWENT